MTLFNSLVIFFIILGPVPRTALGPSGDLSLLCSIFVVAWSLLNRRKIDNSVFPYLLLSLSSTILVCINSVLLSPEITSNNLVTIIRPLKGFIVFLSIYFIIRYSLISAMSIHGPKAMLSQLLHTIQYIILFQALLIVMQFLFPSLLELTYSLTWSGKDIMETNKRFRMPGLAGAGGAQLSAIQGFGFAIGTQLFIENRNLFSYVCSSALIIASIILTGRTGFVLVGMSLLYYILNVAIREKNLFNLFKNCTYIIFASSFIFFITYLLFSYLATIYELDWIINRAFRTYFTFMDTGELNDATLSSLSEMILFPDSICHLFFGNSSTYSNVSSDIGYVRTIFGYGIIGLLIQISFYLKMVYDVSRKKIRRIFGTSLTKFSLFFILATFVLHYKEPFFFARMFFPVTVFIVMGPVWITQFVRSHFKTLRTV